MVTYTNGDGIAFSQYWEEHFQFREWATVRKTQFDQGDWQRGTPLTLLIDVNGKVAYAAWSASGDELWLRSRNLVPITRPSPTQTEYLHATGAGTW